MRVEGWESLLNGYLAEASTRPFAWGDRDCALWAAGWVLACTGEDFGAPWRGRYETARGAAQLMKRRGFAGVADIAAAHLPEIPVPLARRGDLVLHGQGALGICNGLRAHFLTDGGVLLVMTRDCVRAWAVR